MLYKTIDNCFNDKQMLFELFNTQRVYAPGDRYYLKSGH